METFELSSKHDFKFKVYPEQVDKNNLLGQPIENYRMYKGLLKTLIIICIVAFILSLLLIWVNLLMQRGHGIIFDPSVDKAFVFFFKLGIPILELLKIEPFIAILFIIILYRLKVKATIMQARLNKLKKEAMLIASKHSDKLNELLNKSQEIIVDFLPYIELEARKHLNEAKVEYQENAIYPFWVKIEDANYQFELFTKAVNQLRVNAENYIETLRGKKSNFPDPFPFKTNQVIPQSLFDEYDVVVRKSRTNFEFTSIWMHIKQQLILKNGFNEIGNSIYELGNQLSADLYDVKNSIKIGFGELKYQQQRHSELMKEGHNRISKGQEKIHDKLSDMDEKLGYIEYGKTHLRGFHRSSKDN
jgi:hypothetical protein